MRYATIDSNYPDREMSLVMSTPLPRVIPPDNRVPQEFRDAYVTAQFAASITGLTEQTITRHLRNGWLAGLRIGGRLWYVQRHSDPGDDPPALEWWEPGKPGNPNWTNS